MKRLCLMIMLLMTLTACKVREAPATTAMRKADNIVEVGGVQISLPCSYTELINAGYVYDYDQEAVLTVPPNGEVDVFLYSNGVKFIASVANMEATAIPVEEGCVIGLRWEYVAEATSDVLFTTNYLGRGSTWDEEMLVSTVDLKLDRGCGSFYVTDSTDIKLINKSKALWYQFPLHILGNQRSLSTDIVELEKHYIAYNLV